MTDSGFAEIPHTADVALHVWGADLAELFAQAARGMASLLTDPASVSPTENVTLELHAGDVESLLVTWLGELLYLYERDGLVMTHFDLQVAPDCLQGQAMGGPPGEPRYHIKAVTFSNLAIRRCQEGLETTVVFDV